jgi:hypothetical protein
MIKGEKWYVERIKVAKHADIYIHTKIEGFFSFLFSFISFLFFLLLSMFSLFFEVYEITFWCCHPYTSLFHSIVLLSPVTPFFSSHLTTKNELTSNFQKIRKYRTKKFDNSQKKSTINSTNFKCRHRIHFRFLILNLQKSNHNKSNKPKECVPNSLQHKHYDDHKI